MILLEKDYTIIFHYFLYDFWMQSCLSMLTNARYPCSPCYLTHIRKMKRRIYASSKISSTKWTKAKSEFELCLNIPFSEFIYYYSDFFSNGSMPASFHPQYLLSVSGELFLLSCFVSTFGISESGLVFLKISGCHNFTLFLS